MKHARPVKPPAMHHQQPASALYWFPLPSVDLGLLAQAVSELKSETTE